MEHLMTLPVLHGTKVAAEVQRKELTHDLQGTSSKVEGGGRGVLYI